MPRPRSPEGPRDPARVTAPRNALLNHQGGDARMRDARSRRGGPNGTPRGGAARGARARSCMEPESPGSYRRWLAVTRGKGSCAAAAARGWRHWNGRGPSGVSSAQRCRKE